MALPSRRTDPSFRALRRGLTVCCGVGCLTLLLAGCQENGAPSPANEVRVPNRQPREALARSLVEDLQAPRHPADGGGRAWLEPLPEPPRAGSAGRFEVVYEAGPLGIAEGGMLFLQISPFWGWSTPQTSDPRSSGYTIVSSEASGVELEARTVDQQLLAITVAGRALREGERVRMVFGAGAGAAVDRFAERGERLWLAVDGDGDGIRRVLAGSPAVSIEAGEARRLVATLSSTARPGGEVRLNVAAVDRQGNAVRKFLGPLRLALTADSDAGVLHLPLEELTASGSHGSIVLRAGEPGVARLTVEAQGLTAESNPLQVSARAPRVLWGDLQNHSNFSDGTGLPEDFFLYARDIAALDVVSLTDHDHWGMLFLDQHPDRWQEIVDQTRRFHEPEKFVTLLGFEWTNWIYGHRHVLYFGDEGEVLSSIDERYDTPQELWAALRGRDAMTLAHHSAGGPISTDWSIPPDPELEPVTEIVSVHGASEAPDAPRSIYRPVAGNFVRDALARGYRLGFLGSSDGHDGHPGLGHLASPSGGLAAILSEELSREGVRDALRSRRVYATNGPRILLRATYGGYRMGEEVPLAPAAGVRPPVPGVPPQTLVVQALAPGALRRIDVVLSGEVEAVDCEGRRRCAFSLELPEVEAGDYLYVRAVQEDDGAAWSSPFFFH